MTLILIAESAKNITKSVIYLGNRGSMTNDQREIRRKLRILEHAEQIGEGSVMSDRGASRPNTRAKRTTAVTPTQGQTRQ